MDWFNSIEEATKKRYYKMKASFKEILQNKQKIDKGMRSILEALRREIDIHTIMCSIVILFKFISVIYNPI